MDIITIAARGHAGQRPGTSGLRKPVTVFQQAGYLETFVQALFDALPNLNGGMLVLGGDGRYYNDVALQTILRLAAANGVRRTLVARDGLLSTPAASTLIRHRRADGGIILSASHNPGGPDGDFGIKFNGANGGPAPESVTDSIYAATQRLTHYRILNAPDVNLTQPGTMMLGDMTVEVVDGVDEYATLMESLFDFDAIRQGFGSGFRMCFDAMHAVTGPYATEILVRRLGASADAMFNAIPKPDFGGGHPDPNLTYAPQLVETMFQPGGPDFGAASDGDGDRNMIMGHGIFVTPSDSLALMAAYAHTLPGYRSGLSGVARSMPTSAAVDKVAERLKIPCFETPTGWKYFGNLMDSGQVTLCGEESFGTGSSHIREKDGLWAVLFWLNILAYQKKSVAELMRQHWVAFGRHYYTRHDYENIDLDQASALMESLRGTLPSLAGTRLAEFTVARADDFAYTDPVDGGTVERQGIRVYGVDGSRIVFRLSGTGTQGATLRIYFERYTDDAGSLERDVTIMAAPLVTAATQFARIVHFTGRNRPSVIT